MDGLFRNFDLIKGAKLVPIDGFKELNYWSNSFWKKKKSRDMKNILWQDVGWESITNDLIWFFLEVSNLNELNQRFDFFEVSLK